MRPPSFSGFSGFSALVADLSGIERPELTANRAIRMAVERDGSSVCSKVDRIALSVRN